MKILWLDINSSYSHSSVALPAIHAQVAQRNEWEWCVVRGTINDNPGALAAQVAECRPDVIAATFWLFTHQMQVEVLSRAIALLGDVKVICGGPEFLGDNERFLRSHPFVTAIIKGEGEVACPRLLEVINEQDRWNNIEGVCWISEDDGKYHDNGIARVADFASLKYPESSVFFKWDKPFVQLETTRGCFNTCAFCVSGGEKPVRYQNIDQVRARLDNICAHGIKDVRVLDRTFNHDTIRACEMLDLFAGYHGKMRFHLEIHPSLLSDSLKDRLRSLPEGLLHLEAGIQSLDSEVLAQSGRKGSLETSLNGLQYLCSCDNLVTHADLIAGLPSYSLQMLCADVRKLAAIGVDELQIESLKVLPGTNMRLRSEELGLKYSPLPPYEILQTPVMSPSDLRAAMRVSRMIDLYYNALAWQPVVRKLILGHQEFIEDFTSHLHAMMVLDSPLGLERRGEILYDYCLVKYPDAAVDISLAWIEAGCSLKKRAAGEVTRIKNLEMFLSENGYFLSVRYGVQDGSYRYYLLKSGNGSYLFAYDSLQHLPSPVFMASIIRE